MKGEYNIMIKTKKAIISFLMALAMLVSSIFVTQVQAAGEETLPLGSYSIGGFTFTDTNLTPIKTMPAGAQTLGFGVTFRKSPTDAGIGTVKLTMQIRDLSGNILAQSTKVDRSDYDIRFTRLYVGNINVSPGQKYQVFFDASSFNPSESNGNYRSIQLYTFASYINVDEG